MNVWRVTQLLLFPKLFSKVSVEHDLNGNDPTGEYLKEVKQRIARKRKGFLVSFLITLVIVLCGYIAASALNAYYPLSARTIIWARLLSVSIVAWAVLSRLGYETETWKGEILLEITSLCSYKLFYWVGLCLTALTLFLSPKP